MSQYPKLTSDDYLVAITFAHARFLKKQSRNSDDERTDREEDFNSFSADLSFALGALEAVAETLD